MTSILSETLAPRMMATNAGGMASRLFRNRREEKGLPPKGSAKVAAEAAARVAANAQIGSGLSERTYEGLPPVAAAR